MERAENMSSNRSNQVESLDIRKYIYIMKAFALFSVVSAHTGVVARDTLLCNKLFGLFLDSIGAVGVGVFLFISGYLFFNTRKTWIEFIQRKTKTILIPWVFCGTLLYLYVALRKGGLDPYQWLLTLTVHSHLYYLSVLMMLYLLLWWGRKRLSFNLMLAVISAASIILTAFGFIKIYPYINPFNWAIYFIAGILVCKYKLFDRIAILCKRWLLVLLILYCIILTCYMVHGNAISYWQVAAIPIEAIAIAAIIGVTGGIIRWNVSKWIIGLGKISFTIYLLHTPFAGIITNVFNRYHLWYLTLLRPVIVIGVTVLGIECVRFVAKKVKMNILLEILIGYRY